MNRAARDLTEGELVWLRFGAERTTARVTKIEPRSFGEEYPDYARSRYGAKPGLHLEVTLSRAVFVKAISWSTRHWNLWTGLDDEFEIFERPRAAK